MKVALFFTMNEFDMLINVFYILLGFLLLVKCGDYLVDGSVAIARRAKLSPMVIGLTVIGFGTSTPELLVSLNAALAGSPGIAIGNVVGSNIANIALILGATGLIVACRTDKRTLTIDMPFMVGACTLFAIIGMSGTISRPAGIIGFLMLVAFVTYQIRSSRKANEQKTEESLPEAEPMALWLALIMVVLSIAAMIGGAHLLVKGAREVALALGVSERVVGLTIVAVGTSLPELFASVLSARKGETDMAIGNIIGSVSFNVLSVVGLSSAICPIVGSDEGFLVDYILMVLLGFLLWLFLCTKRTLERWEGGVLLAIYIGYIAYTVVTLP